MSDQLAKDRIARFEPELSDPQLLDRLEYLMTREGGRGGGHLVFETCCNRAYFGNVSLKKLVFNAAYYGSESSNKTIPHTQWILSTIQKVIYNGSNFTDLATDQGLSLIHI